MRSEYSLKFLGSAEWKDTHGVRLVPHDTDRTSDAFSEPLHKIREKHRRQDPALQQMHPNKLCKPLPVAKRFSPLVNHPKHPPIRRRVDDNALIRVREPRHGSIRQDLVKFGFGFNVLCNRRVRRHRWRHDGGYTFVGHVERLESIGVMGQDISTSVAMLRFELGGLVESIQCQSAKTVNPVGGFEPRGARRVGAIIKPVIGPRLRVL